MKCKFYIRYEKETDLGTEVGFSRDYTDKQEMWENYEFLTRSGYHCNVYAKEM